MLHPHFAQRSAGLLLHPTSLPGPLGIGDIGPCAHAFIDFLRKSGQTWWQMLPIHPAGGAHSPYDSPSAFAGYELLISIESLVQDNLLEAEDVSFQEAQVASKQRGNTQDEGRIDYERAHTLKEPLFRKAFSNFLAGHHWRSEYDQFNREHRSWVWDYALFRALKERSPEQNWTQWPEALRQRDEEALNEAFKAHQHRVEYWVFLQFIFWLQWGRLQQYAHQSGIKLMGDVPMFVSHDSVDVWANQEQFHLNERGERTLVAGVPPDYFSEDGQLWGNPLYRWDRMEQDGFGWWLDRLRKELQRFDALRIDHFIALSRYWEIPAEAKSAKNGTYRSAPGYAFLQKAADAFGGLPFVAEDLGVVTEDVRNLRDHFLLPGMKVLQFAFALGSEDYLPHQHPQHSIAYTGTHDNNTTRGWFDELQDLAQSAGQIENEARDNTASAADIIARTKAYVGAQRDSDLTTQMVRSLFTSPASTVVIPLQDALDQPASSRMNVPGTIGGNWGYRAPLGAMSSAIAEKLMRLTEVTERITQER